jgi:hypothetical protein
LPERGARIARREERSQNHPSRFVHVMLFSRALIFVAALIAVAPLAHAQSTDPVDSARIQFGPVGLTPSIALTDLGIDTNVFNQVDDPKRDFTFTVAPQLNTWFRAGRSRTEIVTRTDFVYFHEYASERSADVAVNGRFSINGNRVTPWLTGGYRTGRQRVGYEVDARARRETRETGAGLDLRVGAKTTVVLSARRVDYDFDTGEMFLGSSLEETLERRTDAAAVEYRQALTVLTTLALSVEAARDRFDLSPARDTDSAKAEIGFDLSEHALIAGRGRIGYRIFENRSGLFREYRGVVTSVEVGSTIKGRTRVDVSAERDVNYSFEVETPYYVLTGATLTVTPRLTERWDVLARAGLQRLAYRSVETSTAGRTDHVELIGIGAGYRLAGGVRFGVNFDRQRRTSPAEQRTFDGYSFGTSVTYGR